MSKKILMISALSLVAMSAGVAIRFFVARTPVEPVDVTGVLCLPLPYMGDARGVQTMLPKSEYSYIFEHNNGTVVTGKDGHSFSVGPLLIDTEGSFRAVTKYLQGKPLYRLANGYTVHGPESESEGGLFIVSNIGAVKPPYDKNPDFFAFGVYPDNGMGAPGAYRTVTEEQRKAIAARNGEFLKTILPEFRIQACAEKYDPTVNGEGAAEFQKIQTWVNSLPADIKMFMTDAVAVSDAEFSDQKITTATYYEYEQCTRYLLSQAVAKSEAAGTSLDGQSRYGVERLYLDYLGLLRQKNTGSLNSTYPEALSVNNGGSFSWTGDIDKPIRASCVALQERSNGLLQLPSLKMTPASQSALDALKAGLPKTTSVSLNMTTSASTPKTLDVRSAQQRVVCGKSFFAQAEFGVLADTIDPSKKEIGFMIEPHYTQMYAYDPANPPRVVSKDCKDMSLDQLDKSVPIDVYATQTTPFTLITLQSTRAYAVDSPVKPVRAIGTNSNYTICGRNLQGQLIEGLQVQDFNQTPEEIGQRKSAVKNGGAKNGIVYYWFYADARPSFHFAVPNILKSSTVLVDKSCNPLNIESLAVNDVVDIYTEPLDREWKEESFVNAQFAQKKN